MPAWAQDASRRRFLQFLAGAAVGGGLADRVAAQSDLPRESTSLSITPLGAPLRLVSGAGGNVVVLNGASSVLLVNGGAHAPSSRLLSEIAAGTGGKRVEFLFNTDWHPEHTGSNLTVAAAGGQILAHEFTKQYLGIDRYVDWQGKTHKPLPTQALPTQTFTKAGSSPDAQAPALLRATSIRSPGSTIHAGVGCQRSCPYPAPKIP